MPQARADSGPQADHQADVQHLFVYRIHGYCFDTALGLQASPSSAAASGQGPAPRRLLPRQVQVAEVAKVDVDDGGLEEDADDEPRHRLISTRLWRTEVQRDCPGRRKVWTLYTVEALESGIEASAEALYEISSGKAGGGAKKIADSKVHLPGRCSGQGQTKARSRLGATTSRQAGSHH